MKDFKTNYDRNHYYYNRTDPWKHIPFEDERVPEESVFFKCLMVVAAIMILSYVFGFISVA